LLYIFDLNLFGGLKFYPFENHTLIIVTAYTTADPNF